MLLNKLTNPLELCQLKFEDAKGIFTGYASVFGGVDTFGDTIVKGAFKDTLKDRTRPVRMFNSHNPGRPIGIWLQLEEDKTGLSARGELTPDNTDAMNVYASMKHGALDGLSIGFRIPTGGGEDIDGGGRRLTQIDLVEISPVSMPSDDDARIGSIKSIAEEIRTIQTIRDAELFLREAGKVSRAMAKALISQLRPLYQREVDDEFERKEAMARDLEWLRKLTE